MNSEKVKEIKKALKHCGEKVTCKGCPEYNNEPVIDWFKCKKNLLQKTITLINELESENERVQKTNDHFFRVDFVRYTNTIAKLEKENQQLKDRIAELENTIKNNLQYTKGYGDGVKATVEVAYPKKLNEFAERLKESASQHYVSQNGVRISDITYSISDGTINKILKECLCEKQV